MKPPWLEYPEIPPGSVGWRMNGGEDYLDKWWPWIKALAQDERVAYLTAYPPPEKWRLLP